MQFQEISTSKIEGTVYSMVEFEATAVRKIFSAVGARGGLEGGNTASVRPVNACKTTLNSYCE